MMGGFIGNWPQGLICNFWVKKLRFAKNSV